jgi:hypothetical protein
VVIVVGIDSQKNEKRERERERERENCPKEKFRERASGKSVRV